ncbi:MAG: type II toxin-antitoxin system RelE/ParE family toxin [Bradyrhizobium sp.]
MEIIVSDEADNDLMQIASYLNLEAPQATLSTLEAINRCFLNLKSLSLRGSPRPDLGEDVRSVIAQRYLIFYVVRPDHVTILRVLHGSRDIEAEFRR